MARHRPNNPVTSTWPRISLRPADAPVGAYLGGAVLADEAYDHPAQLSQCRNHTAPARGWAARHRRWHVGVAQEKNDMPDRRRGRRRGAGHKGQASICRKALCHQCTLLPPSLLAGAGRWAGRAVGAAADAHGGAGRVLAGHMARAHRCSPITSQVSLCPHPSPPARPVIHRHDYDASSTVGPAWGY